jgi:hypothetical protein
MLEKEFFFKEGHAHKPKVAKWCPRVMGTLSQCVISSLGRNVVETCVLVGLLCNREKTS